MPMLATDLIQIESDAEFEKLLAENPNVMLCCGRNGPMCLPVYDVMETLQKDEKYAHVAFRAMPFDHPVARHVRELPHTRNFMGLPFTIYYKNGEVVAATSSIQNKAQITAILDEHFSA